MDTALSDAVRRQDYDAVIDLLRSREMKGPLTARQYVTLGRSIQLSQRDGTLDEARVAFERALAADDEYAPALLEMGWLLGSVLGDHEGAAVFFRRALARSIDDAFEAADGLASLQDDERALRETL